MNILQHNDSLLVCTQQYIYTQVKHDMSSVEHHNPAAHKYMYIFLTQLFHIIFTFKICINFPGKWQNKYHFPLMSYIQISAPLINLFCNMYAIPWIMNHKLTTMLSQISATPTVVNFASHFLSLVPQTWMTVRY